VIYDEADLDVSALGVPASLPAHRASGVEGGVQTDRASDDRHNECDLRRRDVIEVYHRALSSMIAARESRP
jgi:hypothetical protein